MDQLNANYNPNNRACKKTSENNTNTLQVNNMTNNDNAHGTQHIASQNETNPNSREVNLAVMLNNFIENLAVRLPGCQSATPDKSSEEKNTNRQPIAREKQVRPTSELLAQLQHALTMAPSPSTKSLFTQPIPLPAESKMLAQPISNESDKKLISLNVQIERANFFSKCGGGENQENSTTNENGDAPSTYCTFEAIAYPNPSNFRTYKTKTIWKNYEPEWNEQFTVFLTEKYLLNETDNFYINVWDSNPAKPNISVGTAIIDLRTLLCKTGCVNNWFNLTSATDMICGQIQISIELKLLNDHQEMLTHCSEPVIKANNLLEFLESDSFSATLTKQFEELEGISERLRSRLFDVTGQMDDDFENDLNTMPPEEDDFEQSNSINAMGLNWLEHCQIQAATDTPIHRNFSPTTNKSKN